MFTGSRLRRDPREVVRRWQCGQEKQKLFQSRSLGWWTSCVVVRLPWREDRGVVGWKTKGGFQHIRLTTCFVCCPCLFIEQSFTSCWCTLYLNWIISLLFETYCLVWIRCFADTVKLFVSSSTKNGKNASVMAITRTTTMMRREDSGGVKSEETQATEIKRVKSNHVRIRKKPEQEKRSQSDWKKNRITETEVPDEWLMPLHPVPCWMDGAGPAQQPHCVGVWGRGDQRQSRTWTSCCSSLGRFWEAGGGKGTVLEPILLMLLHNGPNRSKKVKPQPDASAKIWPSGRNRPLPTLETSIFKHYVDLHL